MNKLVMCAFVFGLALGASEATAQVNLVSPGQWSMQAYVDAIGPNGSDPAFDFGCRTLTNNGPCFLSETIKTMPGEVYSFGASLTGGPLKFAFGSADAAYLGNLTIDPSFPNYYFSDYAGTFIATDWQALLIVITPTPITSDIFAKGFFVYGPAVPEPAAWGLLISGLAMTGIALRRRRVRAIA